MPGVCRRAPGRGRWRSRDRRDRVSQEGPQIGRGGAAIQRHRRAHRPFDFAQDCQIGVFLAYASGRGHALIDRELYLPQDWAEDGARRGTAGSLGAVCFATKPQLAQRMIARAIAAGVPFAWVVGDEVYGSDRRLRLFLEQHERPFILTVRSNEKLWWGLGGGAGRRSAGDVPA